MTLQAIHTKGAPEAIGPYNQAIAAGGFVFCSGQIALDPATGELVTGDFTVQADRVLDNLEAVLSAASMSLSDAVRVTIYLTDLGDFAELNEIYAGRFSEPYPARVTVGVASLPKGASIEMEVVAAAPAGGV